MMFVTCLLVMADPAHGNHRVVLPPGTDWPPALTAPFPLTDWWVPVAHPLYQCFPCMVKYLVPPEGLQKVLLDVVDLAVVRILECN